MKTIKIKQPDVYTYITIEYTNDIRGREGERRISIRFGCDVFDMSIAEASEVCEELSRVIAQAKGVA